MASEPFPTPSEAAAIVDLPTAAEWAQLPGTIGVPSTPLGKWVAELGQPESLRVVAAIPQELYQEAARAFRVPAPQGREAPLASLATRASLLLVNAACALACSRSGVLPPAAGT